MIDWINFIVGIVCAFVLGLATHSIYGHERERHGWKFPWDHDDYGCDICGDPVPKGDFMCESCLHWLRELLV